MLKLNACLRREKEEQRQQKNDNDAAVDISHAVPDVRVGHYHESSEEIKELVLEVIVHLQGITRSRTVLQDQVCRKSQYRRSACGKNAR